MALSTRITVTSPPASGWPLSPRSTVAPQFFCTPEFRPAPMVMIRSEPEASLRRMRATTGGTLALSQLGFAGSGFRGSLHAGNTGLHFLTRRSGGLGHSIVAWHTGLLTSGGLGHLSLQPGQPGGAPCAGQTSLHAGFF